MNIEKTVTTSGSDSSTLLVAYNEEAPVEKINVTLVNYDGSVFWNSGIEPGNAVTLPVPSREGYEFVGWSFSEDGSKLFDFSTSITDDITFHAVWKDRSFVHVYFYDGQKLIKEGYYKAGEKHCFPSVDYLGEGFVVSGWLKEGEGRLISDSFFELPYSEEDITFKVYITTDLLTINTNGGIIATDILRSDSNTHFSIVIPNSINAIPVTSIEGFAFWNCKSLLSVTIPDSVTLIKMSAFEECIGLTNFVIPNFITTIEDCAFGCCTGLVSITIPNSVTSIGDFAFWNCNSITKVTIGNSVNSIGKNSFYGCSSLVSAIIPSSVTSIGNCAFQNCVSLTKIAIPDSVTTIGEGVFYGCSSLSSVIIPSSVTSIGDCAFWRCLSLTSVVIPNTVTSIGCDAFYGCSSLTDIYVSSPKNSIHGAPWMHTKNKIIRVLWSDETVEY